MATDIKETIFLLSQLKLNGGIKDFFRAMYL